MTKILKLFILFLFFFLIKHNDFNSNVFTLELVHSNLYVDYYHEPQQKILGFDILTDLYMNQTSSNSLNISFHTLNKTFHFMVILNNDLFSSDASIFSIQEKDQYRPEQDIPMQIAYKNDNNFNGYIRLTRFQSGTFHAVIQTVKNQFFVIDPIEFHKRNQSIVSFGEYVITNTSSAKMVAYQLSGPPEMNPIKNFPQKNNKLNRKLTAYGRMNGCDWPDLMEIVIGVASDAGYTTEQGGKRATQEKLIALYNTVNGLYEDQIGVHLTIGLLTIQAKSGGAPWNVDPRDENGGCGQYSDINKQLLALKDWVSSSPNIYCGSNSKEPCGLWHLHTDCDSDIKRTGNVAGLAYVGTLCSGTTGYNSGVSIYAGAMSWILIAHEIGHNFGARHTFQEGGIMSYNWNEKNQKFYDNGEICKHVKSVKNRCLKTYESRQPLPYNIVNNTEDPCSCSMENLCKQYNRKGCIRYNVNNNYYCYVKGYEKCLKAIKSSSCTDVNGKSLYFIEFNNSKCLTTDLLPTLEKSKENLITLVPNKTSKDPCTCSMDNLCIEYDRPGCNKYYNNNKFYCYVEGYENCKQALKSSTCHDKNGKSLYYLESNDKLKLCPFSSNFTNKVIIPNQYYRMDDQLILSIEELEDPCECATEIRCSNILSGGCINFNGQGWCYVKDPLKCQMLNNNKINFLYDSNACPEQKYKKCDLKIINSTISGNILQNNKDPCACSNEIKCTNVQLSSECNDNFCFVENPSNCFGLNIISSTICPKEKLKLCSSNIKNNQTKIQYEWFIGNWKTCSKACGGGVTSRNVQCRLKETGKIINDTFCYHNNNISNKPIMKQSCNVHNCQNINRKTYGACACIDPMDKNDKNVTIGCHYHNDIKTYGCYVKNGKKCPLAIGLNSLNDLNNEIYFIDFGTSCPNNDGKLNILNKNIIRTLKDPCECVDDTICSRYNGNINYIQNNPKQIQKQMLKSCFVSNKCEFAELKTNEINRNENNKYWLFCGEDKRYECPIIKNGKCFSRPYDTKFCDCSCEIGFIYNKDKKECISLPLKEKINIQKGCYNTTTNNNKSKCMNPQDIESIYSFVELVTSMESLIPAICNETNEGTYIANEKTSIHSIKTNNTGATISIAIGLIIGIACTILAISMFIVKKRNQMKSQTNRSIYDIETAPLTPPTARNESLETPANDDSFTSVEYR